MTEYVPTTGVIRAAYQIARDLEDNLVSFNEFHSWLEQHDAEIVAKAEERFIKLLESLIQGCKGYNCETCDEQSGLIAALALIEGEQKVIHTHEIEVFGAPCDCGTRHEYCGECSWVEPCEPEGEQK